MSIDAGGNYSNQYVRPGADLLAQEYNRGVALLTQWNSLGGGAAATQVMAGKIQAYALEMIANHQSFWNFSNWWNALGQTLVVNNATALNDGSGADGRPTITGAQVYTMISNMFGRLTWLASGTATWTQSFGTAAGGANLATVVACANSPSTSNCGTMMTRITELQTQYQANSNAIINAIQQVGVNVN